MLSANDISKAVEGSWFTEPDDPSMKMRVETDSRKNCVDAIFVAFAGENFDAHYFLEDVIDSGAAVVVVEAHPSESTIQMAIDRGCGILKVKSTVQAYQDMASYTLEKNSKCRLIGITGSSGKTSAKSILAALLKEVFPGKVLSTFENTNNHIGVPQNIHRMKGHEEFAVIEMGTNHPGEIAVLAQCAPPDIAVITSIGDSHSGNFDPVDGILKEKADIIVNMKPEATAVIPFCQVENLKRIGALEGRKYVTFGPEQGANYRVEYHGGTFAGSSFAVYYGEGKEKRFQSGLTGRHQAENCTACLAVLHLLGFKFKPFKAALKDITLPGIRMKIVKADGVRFINDAYNANPQSMKAFFTWLGELSVSESFKGKKILVVGDMLELGERSLAFHKEIFANTPTGWEVIAVGPNGQAAIEKGNSFADSQAAGVYLKTKLKKGDVVALKGSRGIGLEKVIEIFEE